VIFVAVGTERFPFDRLVRAADRVAATGIDADVFVQRGTSRYEPTRCAWSDLLAYEELRARLEDASLVVTHGGVGMTLLTLRAGKTPLVLPRLRSFGEHVDDHQLELAERLAAAGQVVLARDEDEVVSLAEQLLGEQRVSGDRGGRADDGLARQLSADIAESVRRSASRRER
jgi:UDP-N-acetylglucosamine transferase subunit ALG13